MAGHKPKITEKPCAHCGEPIIWTRALATSWEDVLYCDNACKRKANRLANRETPVEDPETLEDYAHIRGPSGHKKRRRTSAQ